MKEPKDFQKAQDQQCPYNCADVWSLYISNVKQIIHGMRTTEKVKCWNSQTVRKSAESTINTIRIKIKTVRESVNPCSMKKMESYTTRRQRLDNTMRETIKNREATQERQIVTSNLKHTCYYISYLSSVDGFPVRHEFTTLTDITIKR